MKSLSKSQINEIAKCQIKVKDLNYVCKKEKCKFRFFCLTNSFSTDNYEITMPRWLFYVPNDEEGRKFLEQLHKYKNKEIFTFRFRGRAKNRKNKGGCREYQPLDKADSVAVYLKFSPLADHCLSGHSRRL